MQINSEPGPKSSFSLPVGGLMRGFLVPLITTVFMVTSAYADGGHNHQAVPTLKKQVGSKIT